MKQKQRQKFRSNMVDIDRGTDIVGDVHGCFAEFMELLGQLGYVRDASDDLYRHPAGRKLISLGDITSRGPESLKMLDFFIRHIRAGIAEMVDSNHGWKIARWLDGRNVSLAHGDEKVEDEFTRYAEQHGEKMAASLKEKARELLLASPSHMLLRRNGKVEVVAVHAGIRDDYIGKDSPAIRNFCRYGDVAGMGPDGRPIRKEWASERTKQTPLIVWGHDPRPQPERKNGSINIDQGCVFGGQLTAYRYPEDECIGVKAEMNYSGLEETPLTRCIREHS
ncbi:metallophosphoesterase [Brevibacillus fulvus]|uniref:Diadenosine tetraphosphatase ApaH/serine/threonine PP2A family protein phosphatase n=1 Tax=Brevibacillus fulvus TaxID=1125967 RepID=A0A939BUP1_9BACL|nr:metallophosphoesterase [Brevibacillus fulvus]MBM7589786.1 diadenosine tetraphosphatase ApaH/serine/threonine PP2A family protein phosphatase [Brevibacillus fulvus]